MSDRTAYFDGWYADMAASSVRDDLLRRHFELPEQVGSVGVLHREALDELGAELRLQPGGLLLDLACGRGGYGIELARRAGARLIGVDISAVALSRAREIAADALPEAHAEFRTGSLTATGLPDAIADAVVCTDSVQFAEPAIDALHEMRRVLRPEGRAVLTTWQPTMPGDERLGSRLRTLDLDADLRAAGFVDVRVEDRPAWLAAELRMWAEAVTLPGGDADPAVASLQAEGTRTLERADALSRVIAVATAP